MSGILLVSRRLRGDDEERMGHGGCTVNLLRLRVPIHWSAQPAVRAEQMLGDSGGNDGREVC